MQKTTENTENTQKREKKKRITFLQRKRTGKHTHKYFCI